MQPDPTKLIEKIGINFPLIGFYDAPDVSFFRPLVSPKPGNKACVFMFYKNWQKGETLHITKDNFGCGGAGSYLFSVDVRTREELINFLVDGEGLKASHELMARWVEKRRTYRPEHPNILIGPLKDAQYEYLKSITFLVNPDQLSALMIGANYNSVPGDLPPVIAPFGSGCSLILPPFDDPGIPQAVIGATDIAMRQFLPPDVLAFTVTKPMFKQLCELDEKSFLYKPFWKNLMKARKHTKTN
jgi:hypothetical protein